MDTKYHIDVTPEEDALFRDIPEEKNTFMKNILTSKVFWAVAGVHMLALSIFAVASPGDKSHPDTIIKEDQKFIGEPIPDPKQAAKEVVEDLVKAEPLPTPPPVIEKKIVEVKQKPKTKYIKDYTIKKGDTLLKVAKKYKLNYDRLIKINGIKNPDKIIVGQKIKFM